MNRKGSTSMIPTARWGRSIVAFGLTIVSAAACGGDATGPDSGGSEDLSFGQIIFEDEQGDLFYSHGDHWHGGLRVETGEEEHLKIYFVSEYQESHSSPPRNLWFSLEDEPEYRLRITVFDPTLASWIGGPHEGRLVGKFPGSTGTSIEVLRGTRVIWTVPTVPVTVTDPTG